MNAHQTYVANLVKKYPPEQIAKMIAVGKTSNASKAKTTADIHQAVLDYGTPDTVTAWSELLARTAAVRSQEGWDEGWELRLMDMIRDLPLAGEGENVAEMRAAA